MPIERLVHQVQAKSEVSQRLKHKADDYKHDEEVEDNHCDNQ